MENQERDMGPIGNGKEEIRRRPKAKERLTIMIFKKAGRVWTCNISSHFIVWASLFFISYIVVTIVLTNAFIDYHRKNKALADQNGELGTMLIKTQKSLKESKQHIALLDDYITEKKDQISRPLSTEDYTESSLPKLVDIKELKIERDKSTITVDFRIINRKLNDEPIGGYIFFLASIKDSDRSEVWVYPNSQLKDGLPVNYRNGQRFFIQRFKSVNSKYTLSKSENRPLIFKILVYDRDGTLILMKLVEA